MVSRNVWLWACGLIVIAADPYTQSVEQWRRDYENKLNAPYTGWLSVAGLHWFKPGANTAGSASSNDIVLPRGPEKIGAFLLEGQTVRFRNLSGETRVLISDRSEKPDTLEFNGVQMVVIDRNGKMGLRIRDAESPMRRDFKGTKWYPIQRQFKVRAKFLPHPYKRTINFADTTGNTQKMLSPGLVEFTLMGQTLRLEPVEDEGQLFFVFKDKTAGKSTYGGGRMLYAPLPVNGYAELDFNIAKNPPCVFTPYATCPLPPKQNALPIVIEAGEMLPPGHSK